MPADKPGHAFIFSVLVFFIMLGLIRYRHFSGSLQKTGVTAFIIACIYAIIIELVQHYLTTDRTGDYRDLLADMAGAIIGWLAFYTAYNKLRLPDKE